MAQALQAIKFARTYLNDINGFTWNDATLMPFLQLAHNELVQKLEINRTGLLKVQSSPILVPALAITLGTSQPSNIINPISIVEGAVGDDPNNFEDMIKVSFIPYEDQTEQLTYWAWIGQLITFLGATEDRSVILRYEGSLATPQLLTDQLGCIFAENYIGPRIASLAFTATGKDNKVIQALADRNLYQIVQSQVTNDQRPVRRRGYRSYKGFGLAGSRPVPGYSGYSGMGGTSMPNIYSTAAGNIIGVMNSVNDTFFIPNFAQQVTVSRNGSTLTQDTDYTFIAGDNKIVFLATMPDAGDIIRVEAYACTPLSLAPTYSSTTANFTSAAMQTTFHPSFTVTPSVSKVWVDGQLMHEGPAYDYQVVAGYVVFNAGVTFGSWVRIEV